ncbi:putative efflux protein, MATE family [Eubacterium ruminantium]|nr:putative efflux protein, MATE family [Eubacterium ruminantium]
MSEEKLNTNDLEENETAVSEVKENKMGVLPIKKLIISMSLPMMISMLVQALYNVVDSIFVAQVSKDALAAVTYAFPMQNLMIAIGSGTGVGINALLSRSLGEKRFDRSNAAANNGLLLTMINALVFLGIGIFAAEAFIKSQVSDPQIVEYGKTYLGICSSLSFGIFFQMTFERLLQSTGLTIYSMISQGTGAIINIIFDPILIFGYFGFPKLGVAGAAYATVLGQVVAATIGLILNLKFNKEIKFSIKGIFTPVGDVIKQIYIVGVPSILMMSIGSVMTYMMNQILTTFSNMATTVFGAYFKLQSFFFMPLFGLNNGLIPVLAYNYGARNKERIKETLSFAIKLAVSIMLFGLVCFQLIPKVLLGFFNPDDEMLRIGVPALRIICLSFPLAGICIAMGSVFQAFSKSIYSLIISIGRQLVALIPAAWLLSKTGNVTNVWWAFPIAEGISLILSSYFFKKVHKELIDTL